MGCNGNEVTLLDCEHNGLLTHNCHHYEDAGVRCTGGLVYDLNSSLQSVKNVSVNLTNIVSIQGINLYTVLITWKLQNILSYQLQPSMYQIECLSNQHRIAMSVNNTTFSVQLVGLLPSTSYNCCVSATYKAYMPKGICVETVSSKTSVTQLDLCETVGRASSSAADTIGGVLGFIIAILLVLLAVLGVALVYLLRPRIFRSVLPKQ